MKKGPQQARWALCQIGGGGAAKDLVRDQRVPAGRPDGWTKAGALKARAMDQKRRERASGRTDGRTAERQVKSGKARWRRHDKESICSMLQQAVASACSCVPQLRAGAFGPQSLPARLGVAPVPGRAIALAGAQWPSTAPAHRQLVSRVNWRAARLPN